MAPGTLDKWHPPALRWRLLHILAYLFHLFPVLRDLEDKEPRLVERTQPAPWRGYQWPHCKFVLTLRGVADTRVVFVSLQDDPRKFLAHGTGDEPWLPHVQHMARGSTKAWQCFADRLNVDPLWCRGAGEGDFFPLCAGNFPHSPKCGGTGEFP